VATLTFVGAAGTVTGSKHLVTSSGGRFYVDCGLFQGRRDIEQLNTVPLPLPPAEIDAIVVTHAHLDHVGYLPRIVRDGFRGPIYCTPATGDLMEIVLEDAANVQEHLHRRGFHHERAHALPPLYDAEDVAAALRLRRTVALEHEFTVAGATLRFREAGHILGSAFLDARIEGRRVIFSGDLGRYGRALLFDPAPLDEADVVVCETTYGDRVHPPDPAAELEAVLLAGIARGGPIVMPAFAVERTQELLFAIGRLQERRPDIARLPVFVDSPMAIKVDALFARFPAAHRPFTDTRDRPFGCRNVRLCVTSDESKEIDRVHEPAIVLASSGMASGGRILFHLHRRLPDPRSTVAFAGWLAPGTLGRTLVEGAQRVRIFGDLLPVQAHVTAVGGFSAHADRDELLRWLGPLHGKPLLYAVHGEPAAAAAFAQTVRAELGFPVAVGARGSTVAL
jgi:metallo-beta-lactamase family protein